MRRRTTTTQGCILRLLAATVVQVGRKTRAYPLLAHAPAGAPNSPFAVSAFVPGCLRALILCVLPRFLMLLHATTTQGCTPRLWAATAVRAGRKTVVYPLLTPAPAGAPNCPSVVSALVLGDLRAQPLCWLDVLFVGCRLRFLLLGHANITKGRSFGLPAATMVKVGRKTPVYPLLALGPSLTAFRRSQTLRHDVFGVGGFLGGIGLLIALLALVLFASTTTTSMYEDWRSF